MVTATADKATPDSTALDSSVIIQNIQPTTGDAVDTAGAKPVNQLLTAKKAFKFSPIGLLRGVIGMIVLIGIAYIFSTNRKAIAWKVVGIGLGIQLLLAIAILQFPLYKFSMLSEKCLSKCWTSQKRVPNFFCGFLDVDKFGYIFAFQVLPTIIFFSALTSLCSTPASFKRWFGYWHGS